MKYFIFFALLILPLMSVEAQGTVIEAGRTAIVGLPGVPAGSNFNTYMNALYALSITIAALLAVIKIIIAGVKWMLTDVVPAKGEAIKDIKGSLLGLLIVLAAVLIISVINRNILDVNLELTPLAAPTNSVQTNNGGGGGGTNPAAGTAVGGGGTNPAAPSTVRRTNTCPRIRTGVNNIPVSDCAGLVSACVDGGGIVADQGFFGKGKITCYAPSTPNTTIGKYTEGCGRSADGWTVDCSEQIAFCRSRNGVSEIVGLTRTTIACYAP